MFKVVDRLPVVRERGGGRRQPLAGPAGRRSRRCSRRSSSSRRSAPPQEVFVDRAVNEYAVALVCGDAGPRASTGSTRSHALHRVRRQPARVDQPDPRRAGARAAARAAAFVLPEDVRVARARRAAPPARADLRGARRGRRRGRAAGPGARRGATCRRSPCRGRRSRDSRHLGTRAGPRRGPGRGPGARGGLKGARPDDAAADRQPRLPASIARLRWASAPSSRRCAPTSSATTCVRSTGP